MVRSKHALPREFHRRRMPVVVMIVAICMGVLPALAAEGDPVQWAPADGGNGHWYQLSPRPVDGLDDAIELAASTTWRGQPGYVVSILSEGEKDFLVSTFGGETLYLIAYTDRDQEGDWLWVSGEPSGFEFWASGEPNDYLDEDYAVMNWQHDGAPGGEPPGAWNDLGGWDGLAIFEYDNPAVSCHKINAKGAGQGAPPEAGDPPGLVRTVAQIRGGGHLQGTTEAAFQITDPTPTGFTFVGDLTFTTNRATLTVALDGTLNVVTGEFAASGTVTGSTGKLEGASGTLTFEGVQDLADPAGSFTETVKGEICVDLGGNGKRE